MFKLIIEEVAQATPQESYARVYGGEKKLVIDSERFPEGITKWDIIGEICHVYGVLSLTDLTHHSICLYSSNTSDDVIEGDYLNCSYLDLPQLEDIIEVMIDGIRGNIFCTEEKIIAALNEFKEFCEEQNYKFMASALFDHYIECDPEEVVAEYVKDSISLGLYGGSDFICEVVSTLISDNVNDILYELQTNGETVSYDDDECLVSSVRRGYWDYTIWKK